MAGHVFISHGSENSEEANALCAFIEGKGVQCWIAPRDVRPGIDYSEELQAAIEGCAAFVVLVTDMANKSPYVRAETEMAFSCHKPIFPVRQADVKPAAGLALFLKIRHWTDAFGKQRDAAMARLALELQTVVGAAPAPSPAPAPAAPPPLATPPPPPAPAPPPTPAPAIAQPRAGGGLSRRAVAIFAVLGIAILGGAVWYGTRPAPKATPPAELQTGLSPRAGDNPLTIQPGTVPGANLPGVGPNGEVDEEALRNALNEARNLLEQQGVTPEQLQQLPTM